MRKSKTMGLLQYRFYNLPMETIWSYFIVLGSVVIAVLLGWTTVATGILLWLVPGFVNFNGMELTERKNTKLQLSFPISRKQHVNIRYLIFIIVNLFAIGVSYIFYRSTNFFIDLNIVSIFNLDLDGLNWLFAQVPFLTIVKIVVGFTLFQTAIYYSLSYTLFKNFGKPPFWTTCIITGVYMMADYYIHFINLTWEQMPTVMFGVGLVFFIISYFISIKAFRNLDFS